MVSLDIYKYRLNAQYLRLFGLHRDVNDAHRAGANRLQNKKTSLDIKTAFDEAQDRGTWQKSEKAKTPMGEIISALLRQMCGLEGKAMFERVESNFSLNRCLRQGSVAAPRLLQKMATQLPANVEEHRTRKRMGIFLDRDVQKTRQIYIFMCADNLWIMSYSQNRLEQMLRDLIQEEEKWVLAPKPASLWWMSTYDSEEKSDLSIVSYQDRTS